MNPKFKNLRASRLSRLHESEVQGSVTQTPLAQLLTASETTMIHPGLGHHVPSVLQPGGPRLGAIPDKHEHVWT
jgi:hypothetical protein